MKNPWNTTLKVKFDNNIKKEVILWYNNIVETKKHLRKLEYTKNPLSKEYRDYLEDIYNEGYGFKVIARWLGISYTRTRCLFIKYLDIKTRRGYNISTDITREFRKKRVSGNKSPWYNWPENMPYLLKNTSTGIQGYYLNKLGKYIWLRSSWEYIYAKWLDEKNILWEYESKTYKLSNGETYRPDFKIFGEEIYLVEIKGSRFKNRLYKVDLFRKDYPNIKIIIIKDVSMYSKIGYKKELKQWKEIRLSEKELKKLQ